MELRTPPGDLVTPPTGDWMLAPLSSGVGNDFLDFERKDGIAEGVFVLGAMKTSIWCVEL